MDSEKKSDSLISRFWRLRPYFGSRPGVWTSVAIAALVGAATEPLIPALLKPLLDRGFQQGSLEIWTVPVSLLSLFGIRGLAGYVSQIGLTKITNLGLLAMRRAMFDKLLTADASLFSTQSSSTLSNTLVYEVQNGAIMLVNSLLSLTRNSLTLLALTGYLFYLNWMLTLIVAAVFPAVAGVMRVLTRRLHHLAKANQGATDNLAYVVEENVLAYREIRLYGAQSTQSKRFYQLNESLQRLAMKSTVAGAAMTPLTQMLAAVALSAVISVALLQSTSSGTSVGGFVAFVTAMLMIIAPIRQLSEVSSPITRGLVSLERALTLINSFPSESEGSFSKIRASGEVHFQNVNIQYPTGSSLAIKNLNLIIAPGETIALVGVSGSGKSTLVNILPRFVDIESGQVLLDGHDVRDWTLSSLRAQFAFVSQHVVLLNDSVGANIAIGKEIHRDKVINALNAANLSGWLETLPQGIDTLLGHNAMQLSGGQRQRLAIARAFYKDAPILIFDEATSALDTESERAVQEAMQTLMLNRTTIIIAHRLSTVRHANRIMVMGDGQIIESGNHEQLFAQGGTYARLHQFGVQPTTDLT